jgi:hypothetical protein
MKRVEQKKAARLLLMAILLLSFSSLAQAETRTVEFRFQLAGDLGSEFSAKVKVFSPGPLMLEAHWRQRGAMNLGMEEKESLSLVLLRPDGTEAKRINVRSGLRLSYQVTEDEADKAFKTERADWTIKLINDGNARHDVDGALRVGVPIVARKLADTQFTLLGLSNAQEIAFSVNVPGRIVIEAKWETDVLAGKQNDQLPLILSLTHLGQARIYARRPGRSPLRIEQQITEQDIDRGKNWLARIQNDNQFKVRGVLVITFTPGI